MSLPQHYLQPRDDTVPSKTCRFCSPAACPQCMVIKQRVFDATVALDRVLEEQRQVKESMNAVHDPMNHLPVKISSHIFSLRLAPIPHLKGRDNILDHFSTPREDATFQLTLCAVSRRWRQILCSNSCFWRFLSVMLWDHSPMNLPSLVQEWLSRSADLSLIIWIEYEHAPDYESDDEGDIELCLDWRY